MAFLQNTFPSTREEFIKKHTAAASTSTITGSDNFSVHCSRFDPNNFIDHQYDEVSLEKCDNEDLEALRRINRSFFMQNLSIYKLLLESSNGLGTNNSKSTSITTRQAQPPPPILLGLTHEMNIYFPLYSNDVNAVLDFEFSSTVSSNKLKAIKKIARESCENIKKLLPTDTPKYEMILPILQHSFSIGSEIQSTSDYGESEQISIIVQSSQCQHLDFIRLIYYSMKNNEISLEAYEKYISNLQDMSVVDRMDDSDDHHIHKLIESSKCRESDFQLVLSLTSNIPWNSTSSYFMKSILSEMRSDLVNLEIFQRSLSLQYKRLGLTDQRDKSLDSQYFDTHSMYILPCYFVPSKHIIQDSSNKKANKLSRSEVNKEEDVTFEMKTRVMKKTTDMKQIVKQLRLYEARYPTNNELSYYIGISVNEEIYCPRKKEDFIKILKENISDWKIGNKEGRYGVKACGKRFKLNNKTYTNTERHQMPDIFEYSSLVYKKYFKGMKSFDLVVSKDDLSIQKVILSRDDGFEAPEQFRTISNVVENSKCVDTEFVKLVSSLWNEEALSQVSLVKYCNNNNLDIEKVEKLSVGTEHRQVIKVSSTVTPDFLHLLYLLARINGPFLLDYCRYYFTSIPKLFDDRKSILSFFVSTLDSMRKRK